MNWQPGDLALCVSPEWHVNAGGVYVVDSAFDGVGADGADDGVGLVLLGVPAPDCADGYDADRFVKITPGTEHQGIEEPRRLPVKDKADA